VHDTPSGGASQSRHPAASTGDVDADGQIVGECIELVDELTDRLLGAIGETVGLTRREHLHLLLRAPGLRVDAVHSSTRAG
jgi:hypothetical protein